MKAKSSLKGTGRNLIQILYLSLGDQGVHKQALRNIASMVRPGGILVIDHRNYDYILETGCAPPGKNIYYKVMLEINSA